MRTFASAPNFVEAGVAQVQFSDFAQHVVGNSVK